MKRNRGRGVLLLVMFFFAFNMFSTWLVSLTTRSTSEDLGFSQEGDGDGCGSCVFLSTVFSRNCLVQWGVGNAVKRTVPELPEHVGSHFQLH